MQCTYHGGVYSPGCDMQGVISVFAKDRGCDTPSRQGFNGS